MLHPRYLKGVSSLFFQALDRDRPHRQQGEFDLIYLVIANLVLQLAHIAEDGTGRTAEDMLVLLAAETGRNLTISPTGYRAALEGPGYPVFFRLVTNRILYLEVAGNFYKFLGLDLPERVSFDINDIIARMGRIGSSDGKNRMGWPDGLGPTIGKIFKKVSADSNEDDPLFNASHPYRFYGEFLACELIYFILCLASPARYLKGLQSRYPATLSCGLHNLVFSLGRSYQPVSGDVADIADEIIARIESVRLGRSARENLQVEKQLSEVEKRNSALGRLFRHELASFLTEEEKSALQFNIPVGMTGEHLARQIQDCVEKARGSKDDNF